ncbi:MAG TPA: GNAT family N-acetyltransferase [Thermoanaerobaculia bacterium]
MPAGNLSFLSDPSGPDVISAVEENVREWTLLKGKLPGVELHDDGDVVWLFSTIPGRGGAVAAARFPPEIADQRICTILEYHRRHVEPTLWWTGPLSTPADLEARLHSHGLHCQSRLPGMSCDLHAMRTGFPRPEGLEIRPLEDFSIFREHDHPFFGPANTLRRRNLIEGIGFMTRTAPNQAWHFVAFLDGVPLGCATVFLGAGVAGLYHVATVARARGQGIGKAVTLAALEHARDLGCRVSILHASTEGEPIYRRIGYREVCRMGHWYYSKERQMLHGLTGARAHWS